MVNDEVKNSESIIIPEHVKIETISGYCTCNCIMCPINSASIPKKRMHFREFKEIVNKFLPYKDEIKFWSLFGTGEPLLDQELELKISYLKKLGFHGTGVRDKLY